MRLSLIYKSIGVISIRVLGAIVGFLSNVLITNSYSKENAGLFFVMLSTYMTMVIISSLGLENLILKRMSPLFSAGKIVSLSRVFTNTYVLALLASVGVMFLAIIMSNNISLILFNSERYVDSINWLFFCLPFGAIIYLNQSYYQSVNMPYIGVLFYNIAQPAIFAFVILINEPSIFDITYGYFVSVVLTFLVSIIYWFFVVKVKFSKLLYSELYLTLKQTIDFFFISILALCTSHLPVVISSLVISGDDIAGFSVSMKLATMITLIFASINMIFAPKFSTLFSQGKYLEIKIEAKKASWIMGAASIPILSSLFFFPSFFLNLFGHNYIENTVTLQILVFGQFILAVTGPYGYVLNMTNNHRQFLYIQTITMLIFPLILFIGTKQINISGSNVIAVAVTLSLCSRNIVCKVYADWKLERICLKK